MNKSNCFFFLFKKKEQIVEVEIVEAEIVEAEITNNKNEIKKKYSCLK